MLSEILSKTHSLYENLSSYQDKVTLTAFWDNVQKDKTEIETSFKAEENAIAFVSSESASFRGGILKTSIVGKAGSYTQHISFLALEALPIPINIDDFFPNPNQSLAKEDLASCCTGNNFIVALLTKNNSNSWFQFPQKEENVTSWHEDLLNDTPCYCLALQMLESYDTEASIQHALQELQGKVEERALEAIRTMPTESGNLTRNITYWIEKQTYAIIRIETKTLDFPTKGTISEEIYEIQPVFNEPIDDALFEA